ncbi:hypothetical protein PQC07_gp149 [Aeromonas phage D3]|uniref:Uncharacterized protein n=1 Tax=Aeromonas phage D3 TaxID=2593327 RepID=A0A514TVT8_9CAUD|nr:hypothetical protein PQC07_gp149 [Aeromonas phage D3]QDJ97124.1 hypothetical protein D3_0126 [Aeromonas phage D3]QEP52431.1 hypothetical protein D9_0224 [Aeromonas phage D9]
MQITKAMSQNVCLHKSENGSIQLIYRRSRDLGLRAYINLTTKTEDAMDIVPGICGKTRYSHRIIIDWLTSEHKKENYPVELFTLVAEYLSLFRSDPAVRKAMSQSLYKMCGALERDFERSRMFGKSKGNLFYKLWEQEVISLDDTPNEMEFFRLTFVKTDTSYNLGLDYRVLKGDKPGCYAGRVDLSRNPPMGIDQIYALICNGVKTVEQWKHISGERAETILETAEYNMHTDLAMLEEVSYRHQCKLI